MLLHVEHTNVADMKALVAGSFWQNFVKFAGFQQLCDVGSKLVASLKEGDWILPLLVAPRLVSIQKSVKKNHISQIAGKLVKSDVCLFGKLC